MLDLVIYIVIGILLGAIVAGLANRLFAKPGGALPSDPELAKKLTDTESSLRVVTDRLERSEEERKNLSNEIWEMAKLKEDLSSKFSSLSTLYEETKRQTLLIENEYNKLKDEHKLKVDAFQELSRNHAAASIKVESLQENIARQAQDIEGLKGENKLLQTNLTEYKDKSVGLEKENKYLKEMLDKQKSELEEIGKKFTNEFKVLADSILEDKSKRFTEINQTNIEQLLKPLGENIQKFQNKVEEVYDRESKERFSLGKEVEKLVHLNQKISEEATNLTNALKGQVKQQGNWGEMILESILEKSGLVKDREYFVQESLKDDEGRRFQPDVIIKYPDDRKVIIDSKVSLVAYERYCSSQDPDEQQKELGSHVRSIRSHIDILSSKGYQDLVGDLDFVTMFLPVEPAFILAMQTDPEIWNYAYSRGVLLLSPTNLIAALRLIHNLWQREYQNRHALEIADRGGKLYDKFVSLVESLTSVGDSLNKSQLSFDTAMKQLHTGSGNLVSQAQKIKELGAKAKKSMPESLLDAMDDELDELPEPEKP